MEGKSCRPLKRSVQKIVPGKMVVGDASRSLRVGIESLVADVRMGVIKAKLLDLGEVESLDLKCSKKLRQKGTINQSETMYLRSKSNNLNEGRGRGR